jgi:hypothetical protein
VAGQGGGRRNPPPPVSDAAAESGGTRARPREGVSGFSGSVLGLRGWTGPDWTQTDTIRAHVRAGTSLHISFLVCRLTRLMQCSATFDFWLIRRKETGREKDIVISQNNQLISENLGL